MQWDYVYADLQLQVTFDADAASPFGQLTDTEVKTLQQLIYHGLMIFNHIRMLYAVDEAKNLTKKDIENALDSDQDLRG